MARRRRQSSDWGLRSGIGSQAASSASNFLLVVSVARVETAAGFGGFALAYSLYLLALGTVRGLLGEAFALQADARGPSGVRDGRAVVGAAIIFGGVLGVALVVVGLVVGSHGHLGQPLVSFGLAMPVLLAQDASRHVGFARGRPGWAALSDIVWLVVQVTSATILYLVTQPAGWLLVLMWGASAACGWGVISPRLGTPDVVAGLRWTWRHRAVGMPFAAEFLIGPGSGHVIVYVVGGVVGVVAAGALRAAQTIFGPLNTLLLGVQSVALPEAAQTRRKAGRDVVDRFVSQLTLGFAGAAAMYGFLAVFLPDRVGRALFAASWPGATVLLLPLALRFLFAAVARGPLIGLRATGEVAWALRVRLVTGVAAVLCAGGGALAAGVVGAAYGMAAAHLLGAALAWSIVYQRRVKVL